MKFATCALAAVLLLSPLSGATQGDAATYSLDQLLALAVQTYPGVAAKRAELDAARSDVSSARWQYFPAPSIQQIRDRDSGSTTTVLALQQPLWAGGRIDAGMAAAKSREDSATVSIEEAQFTLGLQVISAWQAWMQAYGRGVALNKSATLLKGYTDSVRRRIEGGVSAEVDLELVRSRLAQTQGNLAVARSAERTALAQLSRMTGQPLRSQQLKPAPRNGGDAVPLDQRIDAAVGYSPTLRRLDADIEASRHDAEQKRAALWPTLNLRAERQRGDLNNTGAIGTDNRVMVTLDFAPGAGLSAAATADAANARVGSLVQNREVARREVVEQVVTDYEDYKAMQGRRADLQATLKSSNDILSSYDRLFIAGKRGWLDVMNAARELTEVEMALADVEAQLAASRDRLRLRGGELLPGERQ